MIIKFIPSQPHCFAFGGFDIQMINTLNAINKVEKCASMLDYWSRDNSFDIIHLWNVTPNNYNIIEWAKKGNKKIVATILFPYSSKILWLKYYKNYFSQGLKLAKKYHQLVDKYVVLNEAQKEVLSDYYKIEKSKIEIIPNIVPEKFFINTNEKTTSINISTNYILTTGNICKRKNQLSLAKAILEFKDLSLKIVGKPLEGETSYYNDLLNLRNSNQNKIELINELPNNSDEYIALYKNCLGFALPSFEETQPISALEALAMNKKILLMDLPYAKQKYYKGAFLCKNGEPKEIYKTLKNLVMDNKESFNCDLYECKEKNVGIKYYNIYRKLMSPS